MRVIAGSAGGRRLQAVPGDKTRPITDRAKEALFAILRPWLQDAKVLDLFGGTGAVGIEALSRGAAHATIIDLAPDAIRTIHQNLLSTELAAKARVVRKDAFRFLNPVPTEGHGFDLIFVAPPQYRGLWRKALMRLDAGPGWLMPDGMIVVQIHPKEEEAISLVALQEVDRRRYGGVLLLFYGRIPDASSAGGTHS